jgi:hypothetical protein
MSAAVSTHTATHGKSGAHWAGGAVGALLV